MIPARKHHAVTWQRLEVRNPLHAISQIRRLQRARASTKLTANLVGAERFS